MSPEQNSKVADNEAQKYLFVKSLHYQGKTAYVYRLTRGRFLVSAFRQSSDREPDETHVPPTADDLLRRMFEKYGNVNDFDGLDGEVLEYLKRRFPDESAK